MSRATSSGAGEAAGGAVWGLRRSRGKERVHAWHSVAAGRCRLPTRTHTRRPACALHLPPLHCALIGRRPTHR